MFVLSSDITIGTLRFSGVNNVKVKRSLYSYMDSAFITVPERCRLKKKISTIFEFRNTAELISAGDFVKIDLGYNGDLKTEFQGFVKRVGLETPTVIECEGYSWQLRNNVSVKGFLKKTTASELLALAVGLGKIVNNRFVEVLEKDNGHTEVKLVMGTDLDFVNVTLNDNNGCEIIDFVKRISQGTLAIFFINPTTLWCGLTFTPYSKGIDPLQMGIVSYRLGYNCIKDNGLKVRIPNERVQVIYGGTLATGEKVRTESDLKVATRKVKATFNNIHNVTHMKQTANEKQYMMNYQGLEGTITGFLVPFCWPGWVANLIVNKNNKGKYPVTATDVHFGINGARRIVEIGQLLGFKPDK